MTTPDARVAIIAERQHGVFSLAQARTSGFSDSQVTTRVALGRWWRPARGVLAIAGAPPSWQQRAMTALLARPGAVLSHLSAAHAHDLVRAPLDRPDITVPPGTSARAPAATVHRLVLPADQVTCVEGMTCTSPARTLVDLAGVLGPKQIASAVDSAFHGRRVTAREIDTVLDAARHVDRSGEERLLTAVEIWRGVRPGSPGEARLLRAIAERGIEAPARQVRIVDLSGHTVARLDGGWPTWRVGFEYEGIEWHGPSRWEDDARRLRRVEALGWSIFHVGARDVHPGSPLLDRLLRVLDHRMHTWGERTA